MIRKLQIKLIAAAMLSLLLVMSVIVGAANLLNYREIVNNADLTLSILAENKGFFPDSYENWRKEDFLDSPELPYESRYFFIILSDEGEVYLTNIDKIAAVDEYTASKYAKAIWEKGSAKGFAGDYRYIIYPSEGETYIIFLDCSRSLSTAKTFALGSVCVSVIGLCAVLILLTFASGRIVKPFSESYEKQTRFITDAGHELKTPLAIINADAEVLEMDIGENEWLSDICSQTKHLAGLTNDLIELSRMEEKDAAAYTSEFSLSDIVRETAASFRTLAKSQEKELTEDIDEGITIHGDEKSISRLVGILLDNAVKYSEKDGKISIALKEQRRFARLTVYNTTPHIQKENLPHLFDRFYRTDKSRNSQTGGYGLGLSIAASAVNAHKGKITASTDDEKSLLITVTLPL
ncbi:MAG: HAMP domain-containing histidine kinase [Clostridiales bacterium]|nr:HAMP domain-containing histidine kinase [Clostridiales bacterium]